MSTATAPIISPPAKSASYKATNGVSTTTQNGASQISASHSTSSQSSYISETTSVAASYTSVEESSYEKSGECKYEKHGYSQGAEVEFAKLMSEIPWMRFQVTAIPDAAWLQEERFKAVFHALTQKTVRATTLRVISQVKVAMNEVLDRIASSEEHIDMSTVIEDIQKGFMSGACGAVTGAQTLIAGHLPCGCHHNTGGSKCGGAILPIGPLHGAPYVPPQPEHPKAPEPICNPPPAPASTHAPKQPSKAPPPNLSTAQWIWTQEADKKDPPVGARSFRKSITLEKDVDSVTIDITSDNLDTLYINGKIVGSGNAWTSPRRYSVRLPEKTKQIVISVWAMQDSSKGPAGVILAGVAWNSEETDPVSHHFTTDSSWKTQSKGTALKAAPAEKEFLEALDPKYNDGPWDKVYVYGPLEFGVWKGKVNKPIEASERGNKNTAIKGCGDSPHVPPATFL